MIVCDVCIKHNQVVVADLLEDMFGVPISLCVNHQSQWKDAHAMVDMIFRRGEFASSPPQDHRIFYPRPNEKK